GKCARTRAISRGTGPCELLVTSPTLPAACPLTSKSYVMIEHASGKGTPDRSARPCWWSHLPPAIRAVRQSHLQEVPACRTWPWAVLVWLLLGLPSADAQLLRRQATPCRRRVDRRAGSS